MMVMAKCPKCGNTLSNGGRISDKQIMVYCKCCRYRGSLLDRIGGEIKMETKSRYEVIADLENQRMGLIREREGFSDQIKYKKTEIRDLKRKIEDKEEDLVEFEKTLDERKETIKELLDSIDKSLDRFNQLNSQKK